MTYTISNSESHICHLAVRPVRAGFSKRYFSGSNQLIGTIPKEVGNLTTLSVLNFNSNHLEGTIPTELGRCTALTTLDLGNNNQHWPIPLSKVSLAGNKNLCWINMGFHCQIKSNAKS